MISLRITTFCFRTLVILYIDLRSGFLPPLVGHSHNVIVWSSNPLANFSNCFSFKFARQPNANFPMGFGGRAGMSPLPSKILHLSHRRRTLSQSWKTMFDESRILMHSLIDSMFKIGYRVFYIVLVWWSKYN